MKSTLLKSVLLVAAGTCLTANIALAAKNAHTQKVNNQPGVLEQVGNFAEDSGITLSVYAVLKDTTALDGTDVSVSTTDGVVHLIGKLQTNDQFEAAKDAVTKATKESKGYKSTNTDNLIVQSSNQPMTDAWITAKAKAMLLKDRITNSHDTSGINVETTRGKIYLTGKASADEAAHAEQVVNTLDGLSGRADNKIDTKI